jgi:hexosaminidase
MKIHRFLAPAVILVGSPLAAAPLPLIPQPVKVEAGQGRFPLTDATAIRFDRALAAEAELLAAELAPWTGGRPRTVAEELKIKLESEIRLDLEPASDLPAGGYRLTVGPGSVSVTGKDAAAVFHGTRTLLQLLPPGAKVVALPAVSVTDHPRFAWRGMHLDVGRHLFPVADIKRFLDQLAFHKLNTFHWHLTEDQGWRIEIKKYPKLTEIGAFRESSPPYGNRDRDDGKRYGGFYTQEQVKEVVAYAAARHITVVPEIELPGHAAAAIAAYPEFGNSDIPGYAPKVMTRWGVHPYTFAPKEETFRFLEDVLGEVCALFPSKFIHIGGDEAPKDQWNQSAFARQVMQREGLKDTHELQSWFIRRIEKFLATKGRRLVGWDEIQEGGLPKTATMMVWRDAKWAKHALALGNDVVMAPNSHLYLDHYQAPAAAELAKGLEFEAIGGFSPIAKVYSYDPAFVAEKPAHHRQILGVQAQLWTEYMKDWTKVEYMAFPRLAALAEVAWTPLERKDYADFRCRLEGVMKFHDAAGIRRAEPFDPPARKAKDGATVDTSLGTYQDHWAELAFDGRPDTFFWADRALREGDHFTLTLGQALAAPAPVAVATGGPASRNGDQLEAGTLEVTADGTTWQALATFAEGKADGTAPAGTKALRLRVTKPQSNWLIVHEFRIGAKQP